MDTELRGPVVVGVNGSAHSLTAVDIAAREAVLRRTGLHLINVIEWPNIDVPIGTSRTAPVIGRERERAQAILVEAATHAHRTEPTLAVTTDVIVDATRRVLVEASRAATLLVVGRRPGLAAFLPDPIGVHLAAHAMSPAIITTETSGARSNIVAGTDATPVSADVLDFAFHEAQLRGTGITVASRGSANAPQDQGGRPDETDAARVLADLQGAYPDVKVQESPVDSLIQTSGDAQMLVVGAPAGALSHHIRDAGSVHALLRRAMCPVAVIPRSRERAM